ncbi:uncharacterized protein CLUP02_07267, partial [Colletotrichum lupini]
SRSQRTSVRLLPYDSRHNRRSIRIRRHKSTECPSIGVFDWHTMPVARSHCMLDHQCHSSHPTFSTVPSRVLTEFPRHDKASSPLCSAAASEQAFCVSNACASVDHSCSQALKHTSHQAHWFEAMRAEQTATKQHSSACFPGKSPSTVRPESHQLPQLTGVTLAALRLWACRPRRWRRWDGLGSGIRVTACGVRRAACYPHLISNFGS